MYIDPKWRVLTVGDGDLSFSASLLKNHQPQQLTATIYDSMACLQEKYGDDYYQQLQQDNCQVITDFDVTDKKTWGKLVKKSFDLVIFQFPLLPAFSSEKAFKTYCETYSVNTLNRALLRKYLLNCFQYFLDDNGVKLAFITSKNVKPYLQWNIEKSLIRSTDINYIGRFYFDISKFPDYKVRNVNRDKHVKSTQGTTYIYSLESLENCKTIFDDKSDDYITYNRQSRVPEHKTCQACRTGAFATERDKLMHLATKKHQQMFAYEEQWSDFLQQESANKHIT
jgi:25S rRNA (uracil2634-N3)-methyltransferase